MKETVIELFEIPEVAQSVIPMFMSEVEVQAIELMQRNQYPHDKLIELLCQCTADPKGLFTTMWTRALIMKDYENTDLYSITSFWRRITYFAQYETDQWRAAPEQIRTKIDNMYVDYYAQRAQPRLELSLKDPTKLIENAYFFTLDETLHMIDKMEQEEFYIIPCNCKRLSLACEDKNPYNVCVEFGRHPNSDVDRGHGKMVNKDEVKALIVQANKRGLMQTTEMGYALCNCCSCCCYPIRGSERLGTKGLWPKQIYKIHWDEEKCIHCGKCATICNFDAFEKKGKKVIFHKEKCWGCTICSDKCPRGAITLEQIAHIDVMQDKAQLLPRM